MNLFQGITGADLATASVACISAATVWGTFWTGQREKRRDRRHRQLAELEVLRIRVRDDIEPWAGPERLGDAHDHNWYDPAFRVRPFSREHVERFNRLVIAGDYPQALTAALIRLEDAAERLHDALQVQEDYRNGVANPVVHSIHAIDQTASRKGAALTKEEIAAAAPRLDEGGVNWVEELYRRNRVIHTGLLGRAGQRDGLHDAWLAVTQQVETTRTALQRERDPRWSFVGHCFAVLFALIGLLFLWKFGRLLWDEARARLTPAASTSAGHEDGLAKGAESNAGTGADTAAVPTPSRPDGSSEGFIGPPSPR